MEQNYSFNTFNKFSVNGIGKALYEYNLEKKKPIFICIGSDLVVGDSLGPLVGTLLKKKNLNAYVYGTLNLPITAKEIEYAKIYIKKMHPNSILVAIDAAVGNSDDTGIIKVNKKGLKPGAGVNKELGFIGDLSIIGIVATKSLQNENLYNLTRLNLIFKMAETISDSIEEYLKNYLFLGANNEIKGA